MTADTQQLIAVGRLASDALRIADDLVAAVAAARESGATWQQIADELGVTRQAAHQRYGKDVPASADAPAPGAVDER